jgi:HK97 gp10 family phage protein
MASGLAGFRIDSRDTRMGAAQIEGLREVQKALRDMGGDLLNEMKPTHLKAAEIVVPAAKQLAPVRSGRMAASIRAAAVRSGGRVRVGNSSVPYAGPIHFGWPARRIKPQPFVYEALDPRRDEVAEVYAKRLNELVVRYGIASDKAGNVYGTKVG